jgi:hypothetical protein
MRREGRERGVWEKAKLTHVNNKKQKSFVSFSSLASLSNPTNNRIEQAKINSAQTAKGNFSSDPATTPE